MVRIQVREQKFLRILKGYLVTVTTPIDDQESTGMNRRGFLRGTAIAAGAFIFGRTQSAIAASPKKIVKASKFPVGSSQKFVAANGAPAYLFRTKSGVFAYSAICTHQGCTVDYLKAGKKLICPCHGGSFDPFNSAKVVAGPPERPLDKISVTIKNDWIVQS